MKRIVLFLLFSLALVSARGNECEEYTGDSTIYGFTRVGYLSVGGSYFDLDDLNSSLAKTGFPTLDNGVVQIAIGNDYRFNRLITDFAFTGHWWRHEENSEKRSRLFGLDLMTTMGYDFTESPKVALYPFAGIGFGTLFLQQGHRNVPFDTISSGTSPVDQLLTQMTLDIHTGVGFDVRAREHGRSPLFGIKAGYRFDVSDGSRWYRRFSTVSGGPSLKTSGPFVKLVFGFAKEY